MKNRVGDIFGNYRLTTLLGRGGFAEVYLGEHQRLKTQAAIKVLYTQLSEKDVEGFLKEAQFIANLDHPNIVRVFDFDVLEEGTPFLVMNYAPYGTLRQLHPKDLILSPSTIIGYVKQIADALQYAHDEKIIHRDIKPENMLLGKRKEILLSDFGIALVAQSSRYQSTQEMAGTMAYMAPEQIQGKPRPASDQYALGIVVYEWLSGQRPFHGSFTEIVAQHLTTPPKPLREMIPTISPAIQDVVMTALAKDPKDRFSTVQAFANALEQACQPDAPTYIKPIKAQDNSSPFFNFSSQTTPPTPLPSTEPAVPFPTLGTVLYTFSDHSDVVNAITWSPDGRFIASGSKDKTVRIWDAANGILLYTPRAHDASARTINAIAWSPDGKHIILANAEGSVNVLDTATQRFTISYVGHNGWVRTVAFSPNGQYIVSAGYDTTVQIWKTDDGHCINTYRGHTNSVYSVAWSPDGKSIASGGDDNTIQIWSAPGLDKRP